jgi:hypothetical protein
VGFEVIIFFWLVESGDKKIVSWSRKAHPDAPDPIRAEELKSHTDR